MNTILELSDEIHSFWTKRLRVVPLKTKMSETLRWNRVNMRFIPLGLVQMTIPEGFLFCTLSSNKSFLC